MTKYFFQLLHETIKVLAAFSDDILPGSRRWDGKSYAPAAPRSADAYAAKWWGLLSGVTGMLDGQDTPISPAQLEFLRGLLFRGMGSLQDFRLDESRWGTEGEFANRELDSLVAKMFQELVNQRS